MFAGLAHHAFDLFLVQVGRRGDGHFLLFARCFIPRRHIQDAIGVNIEGDFDLRQATRRRRDAFQAEAAQAHIVASHRSFALQHMHIHGGLIVFRGGEHFGFLHRDGGVALDQGGHYTSQGFQAEGKRGDIQQKNIFDIAC